jgi:RNA polymerase sigma-70 factor (ECF subfamily)
MSDSRAPTQAAAPKVSVVIPIYNCAPTLGAIRSVSGWLFIIVHRLCLRMAKAAVAPVLPFEVSPRASMREASDEDLRIDLARAIESLPEKYRIVLLLRDVEELTVAEIAGRLGTTREAVKARLHRARRLVREFLA